MIRVDYKKNELQGVLNEFDILDILQINKFKKGVINTSFKVTTKDKEYVLRIYSRKGKKELEYEVALLNHLTAAGLPTPHLVKNKKNTFLTKINKKYACLYKFIKGQEPSFLNTSHLVQIGEFLARFHTIGETFTPIGNRDQANLGDMQEEFEKYSSSFMKTSIANKDQYIKTIKEELFSLSLPDLPQGPLHLDIKAENTLFENDVLTGIIDFDNGFIGPYILDIGKTMMWLCCKNGINIEKCKSLLDAYTEVRNLSNNEKKHLFTALRFAFIGHVWIDFYLLGEDKLPLDYVETTILGLYNTYFKILKQEDAFNALLY